MSGDLIGSRISLISKKDIRWEGILVHVDRENASVTLQNVKSWGTEGRLEGDQQIPPTDQLHACVNFRGEDIKDLHVHETAEPPAPAPPQAAPTPPAPPVVTPAVNHAAVAAPIRTSPDMAGAAGAAGERKAAESGRVEAEGDASTSSSTMRDQGLKPGRYQPPHKNPNWKPPPTVERGPPGPGSGAGSGTGALPGQGNHLLNRRTRGGGGGPSEEEGEFDFQAGLAKFDKEKEMALLAGGVSLASIHDNSNLSPPMNGANTTNGIANGTPLEGEGVPGGVFSTGAGESSDGMGGGGRGGGGGGGRMAAAVGEGSAVAAAIAAASASRVGESGETRSAADGGGEVWVEPPVVVKKYNKSSFFDEISCDALDGRGRIPGGRGGERTRNTETFGATSVALSAGSRRYGGRGGGGYSNYTGGRRGGYGSDRQGDGGYRGQYQHGGGGGGSGRAGNRQESSGNWRRS